MATRANVRKTDNSKLGRGVLTNRAGQPSLVETASAKVEIKETPKVVAKKATKKTESYND